MSRTLRIFCAFSMLFAAACGEDAAPAGTEDSGSDTSSDTSSDTGSDAGSGITFPASKLSGALGCTLDAECDAGKFCFLGVCAAQCTANDQCSASSCSARGKCEQTANRLNKAADGSADAAPAGDRLEGIALLNLPNETIYVAPGESFVTVTVRTTGPVLAKGGLAYRIDTTADPTLATVVTLSSSDEVHTIRIPTGSANPSLPDPHVERAYVTTNAGAFPLTLIPRRGIEGAYGADAVIPALGTRIPLGFAIVTVPTGASIQDAESVYLVMNAANTEILAPVAAADAGDAQDATGTRPSFKAIATAVIYDPNLERWVARFDNGFAIPAGELFGGASASQTQRSLRFEFVVEEDGRIAGDFTDTWSGLFNQAAADHTETVGTVQVNANFVASRVGPPPSATNIAALAALSVASAPALRTYPADPACDGVFSADANCFDLSTRGGATACANSLRAAATAGGSLTDIVADLFADGSTADGRSYTAFLAGCADGSEPACTPTAAATCAAQAAAIALRTTPSAPSADADTQWQNYATLLLQLTGGPQLAAYYLDVDARKKWLTRSQFDASSPVTATALKTLNEQLMTDWLRDVVDSNITSLRDTLQPATFAFMSRAADSTVSIDERDRLLISMVNAWGIAANSLGLAAQRYSELYRLDSERAAKRDLVAQRTRELYMSAIVIIQLHQAAGKAAQAASIATGLGALLERQALLSRTFDELLFARDGEVVVSTSLDPNDTSNGVLRARRDTARAAIDTASTSVEQTLATIASQSVQFATLVTAAEDAVGASQDRMIELCGIPEGCGPNDLGDAACDTSWEAGLCGFNVPKSPLEGRQQTQVLRSQAYIESLNGDSPASESLWEDSPSPSEAGLALVAYRAAAEDYLGAVAEQQAAVAARQAEYAQVLAFADGIEALEARRLEQIAAVQTKLNELQGVADAAVALRATSVKNSIDTKNALLSRRKATMKTWQSINASTTAIELGTMLGASYAESLAEGATARAQDARTIRDQFKEGLPTIVGTASDPSFGARTSANLTAAPAIEVAEAAAEAAKLTARRLTAAKESAALLRESTLSAIDVNNEFDNLQTETDIAANDLVGELEILTNDANRAKGEAAIEQIERQAELDNELADRLYELQDRRNALLDRVIDDLGHTREVAQAQLSVLSAYLTYQSVVAAARQERANLEGVRAKLDALNNRIGGPEAFMTEASKLGEADRQIDRAKRKLNDWLVAIEYFAVRPFFDERMAIVLAKSSYELKKIADRLDDLQAGCGGRVSSGNSEVSVRGDLLGYRDSIEDGVTGTVMSPADRFQETIQRGVVPVNQRTRYTASDSLGSLLQSRGVLSASFVVALGDFANLAVTCNAKVMSVAIKLEGEGIGSGQPVVTLLYEGSSQLYSCQPGISEYVETFGQNSTAFDTVTTFQVTGRSGSPVAGINAMGSPNNSFSGLPLASRYTVLIDPALPANRNIDWSKVTDIKLGLSYDYQDPFPASSLCGSSR